MALLRTLFLLSLLLFTSIQEAQECMELAEVEENAWAVTEDDLTNNVCSFTDLDSGREDFRPCFTAVYNSSLVMGCLNGSNFERMPDEVKDSLFKLCTEASSTVSKCNYEHTDSIWGSRYGEFKSGHGLCCCWKSKCNKLPPAFLVTKSKEELYFSGFRIYWRAASNVLIIATIFTILAFIIGYAQGKFITLLENKGYQIGLSEDEIKNEVEEISKEADKDLDFADLYHKDVVEDSKDVTTARNGSDHGQLLTQRSSRMDLAKRSQKERGDEIITAPTTRSSPSPRIVSGRQSKINQKTTYVEKISALQLRKKKSDKTQE